MRSQEERDEQTVTITITFVVLVVVGLPALVVLAVLASVVDLTLSDKETFLAALILAAAWVAIGLARSTRR